METVVQSHYREALKRAGHLAQAADHHGALAAYGQAIELAPWRPDAHYEMGLLHHKLGQLAEAVTCFERAAELAPQDATVWNNLGVLYFSQGALEKAAACLEGAIEIDPEYVDGLLNAAKVLAKLGRIDQAEDRLRRCLQIQPGSESAMHLMQDLGIEIDRPMTTSPSPTATAKLSRLGGGERIRIRVVTYAELEKDLARRKQWADYWVKQELEREFRNLGLIVDEYDPDVILYLFGVPARGLPRNTYNMVWVYSHPDMVTPRNLREFHKVFSLSASYAEKLRTMGYPDVEVMIGATSKKPLVLEKKYDIVFVGNARGPQGRKIVRDVGDVPYDLKVWGRGWERLLAPRFYGGSYYDYEKLSELYASSLVSVNDHHPDMAREGFVSVRIFDILASGGFAISDRNAGIEEIFGDTVPQYETAEHLRQLLDRYITHPDERRELMDRGREIALSHTWRERAKQFVRAIRSEAGKPTIRAGTASDPQAEGPRVLYIDFFRGDNSNLYWLKSFRRAAQVEAFDIRDNIRELEGAILAFRPTHIHLGGSVKSGLVQPHLLRMMKEKLGCSVSAFYGDASFSEYHSQLARVIDRVYVSNKTHIRQNAEAGLTNYSYMPCPSDPKVWRPHPAEKRFDLLFIANNNDPSRLELLRRIHEHFKLVVAGARWEGTGLHSLGSVYGEQFGILCSKARILLGLVGDQWQDLEAYFSSRLVNVLATGSFLLQTYTPGLETVFVNGRHLVWYKTEDELFSLLDYYLAHEEDRARIATQGREKVLAKYTYDKSVARILAETQSARANAPPATCIRDERQPLKLHLGCGGMLLPGYVNIDKYNPNADRIMDAGHLDYPDNSVDEIYTSHMIEHVPQADFVPMLVEWKRVLKESGRLLIRCPNHELYIRMWLEGDDAYRWGAGLNCILGMQDRGPGHLNRNLFSVGRLRDLVEQVGFDVIRCVEYPTRTGHIANGDILCDASNARGVPHTPARRSIAVAELDRPWKTAMSQVRPGGRFSMEWFKRHPITQALLRSEVLKGAVLDVGCGTGHRAKIAWDHAQSPIVGIEGSAYAVEYAQRSFQDSSLRFVLGDVTAMPFRDHSFDNAYMLAVIEHIPDTDALLAEICRVLVPGGKLFVSVTQNNFHWSPDHVHVFSADSVRSAVAGWLWVLSVHVREHIIFLTAQAPAQ